MKNPEVTYVPISALNRGNAIHVIEEVKEKDCAAFILKNNVPEAVIISAERFRDYQDYLFYRTVAERVEYSLKHPEEKRISLEEVLKKAGIGKEDLERIGDVEFEYK